jgi:spermidine/putrescine transport system permease protein
MKRCLSLYAAAAFAFLYVPLMVLIVFSFNASRFTIWTGWSLDWYRAVFRNTEMAEAAWNSVIIAILSSVISAAIGTLAAYGLWKRRSPWLTNTMYLSLVTPEIVTGISLLAFFQLIFRVVHLTLGLYTVVLAHIAFSIVYVAIVVAARLRSFDPAIEEAALDLGATPWRAFLLVTLPSLWPGIVAASLLALIVSFDDYVITSLVAGVDSETLPMVIYAIARRGANPAINAVSTLIVVGFGALILISERVRRV